MHAMMLVNMPVADVERSRRFFSDLGYAINDQFSGDNSVTLVLGEKNQFAMLVQRDLFDSLHPVETADATKVKECVVCLTVDSREAVDALVNRALAAGGTEGDAEDHGSMYGRSYNDLDGHSWQIFWMDAEAGRTNTRAPPQEWRI